MAKTKADQAKQQPNHHFNTRSTTAAKRNTTTTIKPVISKSTHSKPATSYKPTPAITKKHQPANKTVAKHTTTAATTTTTRKYKPRIATCTPCSYCPKMESRYLIHYFPLCDSCWEEKSTELKHMINFLTTLNLADDDFRVVATALVTGQHPS